MEISKLLITYLHKKFAEEYHQLSLWYFVSFIFGIVFFFQGGFTYPLYFVCFVLFVSIFIVVFFCKKSLITLFTGTCLLAFVVGGLISGLRMHLINTKPISKPIISEVIGQIEHIKPTLRGTQITLNNVSLKNNQNLNKIQQFPPTVIQRSTIVANVGIQTPKGSEAQAAKKLDPYVGLRPPLDDGRELPNKIRINIADKLAINLSHGDKVKFKAKLFPLATSVLPDTYDFGFYMYMSGIEASGYALTTPEIIDKQHDFLGQYIQMIRNKIYRRLIDVLGANNGNFAAAILIGETKAIPKNIAENMRNSGVAHILSVSGLHLSLVAMIFFVASRMLLNCSNYLAYNANVKIIAASISIICSFLYLQISGGNIAATRAFIMTAIFIIAIILGRTPYPLRSVMIAAFLILLFLPEYLFHPSFQLSFAAVLCLISGYEFYLKHKYILGKSKGVLASIKFYVFANIYSSFLASIVTAPFVIYHFYKFATYSVLMNLIAVPLMSFFMMPLAMLSLLLMPFALDEYVLKLLSLFITIIIDAAAYIVSLPASVWVTGYISRLSLLIFTFGFFWLCLWQTSWRFLGFIIIACSLIIMFSNQKPDFIYDHNLKIVAIKNKQDELEIYTNGTIPKFISDYWISWYGQSDAIIQTMKIAKTDQVFFLADGKKISLNYWRCLDADVQIITSKRLECNASNQIITNSDLWKYRQILLYCGKDNCRVEYGE